MADKQTLAIDLAILAAGRVPRFTDQAEVNVGALPGRPALAAAGIDISDAIVALVGLRMRKDVSTHQVIAWVSALDPTATYTITLGGTPFNYIASLGNTEEVILEALRALIDADPAYVAPLGSVTGTGPSARLAITGATEAAYTSAVGATGTGAMMSTADAQAVDFKLWGLAKNQVTGFESTWHRLPVEGPAGFAAPSEISITENWMDELRVPGYSRIYVEVTATDGTVTPTIGPAGPETLS